MKTCKHLSASELFRLVRQGFARIKDARAENTKISLGDALMSGFALFSLKDASLLAFEERQRTDGNLKRVYGLEQVPSDTQMRTILDEVDPENLRPVYGEVFRQLHSEVRIPTQFARYWAALCNATRRWSSWNSWVVICCH